MFGAECEAGDGDRAKHTGLIKRFQSLAEPRKAFFEGSAFVGHLDLLTPAAVFEIADEMCRLLYSAIGFEKTLARN